MKYLFINNDVFGFKASEIHEILETDIEISDEIYNRFFQEQSKGKQFKVLNINGTTFEEIFVEVIPEVVINNKPTTNERLALLESAMNDLLLGGV